MRIGILGSGIVGQTLAKAFTKEGHEVTIGTRDTSKKDIVQFKAGNAGIAIDSFEKTAAFGELLVLATHGLATADVVKLAGTVNFSGKVVIDATNPIAEKPPVNGVLQFFTGPNESLMETLQQLVPDAKLVKAFNSVGSQFMYKPGFTGGPPTMFICGNDDNAKATVAKILDSFGWETADMGKMEAARAIEPLCMLWCIPGMLHNQWSHAFKLLKA